MTKRNFFDNFPTFFEPRDLFKGFDPEYEKIINGKCDFEETDDKYIIELEVPGVKKDEINLNLKNETLTISWSRKKENKSGLGKSRFERSEGSFTRSFDVEGADPSKVDAELKNGVLKVVLTKQENSRPKKIEIR